MSSEVEGSGTPCALNNKKRGPVRGRAYEQGARTKDNGAAAEEGCASAVNGFRDCAAAFREQR